jgi:hypothetical protein
MDVEEVLHKMESMDLIKLHKISGDYYQVYCPVLHDGRYESKPSCGILLHDIVRNGKHLPAGWCHCFSCGLAKPLPATLSRILRERNIDLSGVEWLKENVPGFTGYDDPDVETIVTAEQQQIYNSKFMPNYMNSSITKEFKYPIVPESELATYRQTVPYMYQRGLTDEIIEKYDIGYDPNFTLSGKNQGKPIPCVTFPVRNLKGETLFLCRRSIAGKLFHYPQGVEKSVYGLYELPDNPKEVIICESCFNALTLVKYGYNAVALLGTGTSYEMQQLRRSGIPTFTLCLDGDTAGQKATKKLKRALKDVAIVWTMHMPEDRDANQCTKEEIDQIYALRD